MGVAVESQGCLVGGAESIEHGAENKNADTHAPEGRLLAQEPKEEAPTDEGPLLHPVETEAVGNPTTDVGPYYGTKAEAAHDEASVDVREAPLRGEVDGEKGDNHGPGTVDEQHQRQVPHLGAQATK